VFCFLHEYGFSTVSSPVFVSSLDCFSKPVLPVPVSYLSSTAAKDMLGEHYGMSRQSLNSLLARNMLPVALKKEAAGLS
jgi:hypothetical protein